MTPAGLGNLFGLDREFVLIDYYYTVLEGVLFPEFPLAGPTGFEFMLRFNYLACTGTRCGIVLTGATRG